MTNKSSVSMRPRLAADDVEIKLSELAIGGVEPYPLLHVAGVRIVSTVPANP
jgi:hypothetical protein